MTDEHSKPITGVLITGDEPNPVPASAIVIAEVEWDAMYIIDGEKHTLPVRSNPATQHMEILTNDGQWHHVTRMWAVRDDDPTGAAQPMSTKADKA